MEEVKANVMRCMEVIPKGTHPSIVAVVGSQLLSSAIAAVSDTRLQLDMITHTAIKMVKADIQAMYEAKKTLQHEKENNPN